MAQEQAVVRGLVAGEPGTPVAGWVSLGKKQPQRWLSHAVRITTEAGHEVTLEGLSGETIVPVEKREVRWRELEGTELARLCEREAPAPDVEVDFHVAVLRGGDAIVAWGDVTEHGYVGGDAGEAFRGTAERGIKKLTPQVIATGDDREALLERTRERLAKQEKEAKPAKPAQPEVEQAPKRKADPDYVERIGWNLPLWVTLAALAIVGGIAAATGARGSALRVAAVFAWAPIALDAMLLPRFRHGIVAPPSLEVPFFGFLGGAVGTAMTSYALAVGDVGPQKIGMVRIVSSLFACVALLALGWLWSATRTRRRWVAMMVKAEPHPHPMRDGVWGATDGVFSSEVMAIGENATAFGARTKDSTTGLRSRSVSVEAFANLTHTAPLRTAHTAFDVRLAEAAILTVAKLDRSTGTDKGQRADVINGRTPVRVVGRARGGVFAKGGEASLLVFAGPVDSTDVGADLRRLHRRDLIALAFAALGVASLVASFVIA